MVLPPSCAQEPSSNRAQCRVQTGSGVVLLCCGKGPKWLTPELDNQKAETLGQEEDRGYKQKIQDFSELQWMTKSLQK